MSTESRPSGGRGASPARFSSEADALLDRIAPLLSNHPTELQGAVIADLAAIWIAGHQVGPSEFGPGNDRSEGDRLREELLQMHLVHVRELVELYLGDADG